MQRLAQLVVDEAICLVPGAYHSVVTDCLMPCAQGFVYFI